MIEKFKKVTSTILSIKSGVQSSEMCLDFIDIGQNVKLFQNHSKSFEVFKKELEKIND